MAASRTVDGRQQLLLAAPPFAVRTTALPSILTYDSRTYLLDLVLQVGIPWEYEVRMLLLVVSPDIDFKFGTNTTSAAPRLPTHYVLPPLLVWTG